MADDRIFGQVNSSVSKLNYRLGLAFSIIFVALCAVIFFMMPWINSLEDETTAKISQTLSGRMQIAASSLLPLLIFALIPAALSYGFCRLNGVSGGRPLKSNRAFQIARTVYLVLVFWGVSGAISFVMGRTIANGFGF
jgi:hypothetical protein